MTTTTLDFLESMQAQEAFAKIQLSGTLDTSIIGALPANDRAFLIGELYVRTSRYSEISGDLPEGASDWFKRMALCTGYLFTAPLLALKELDFLEPLCHSEQLRIRFKTWRMHLCVLVGFEKEGIEIRKVVESYDLLQSPFAVELHTLLAVSYFSTAQSKKAISLHHKCVELTERFPERYFTTFGSALGMRAALKICDARSFDIFSKVLEESLAHEYDNRYRLRQLGYRASILSQLGEVETAEKYWQQGDLLLEVVDQGAATVERAQYFTFRCLAAALLGDLKTVKRMHKRGIAELATANFYEVHLAELEVCKLLAPIANPTIRVQNIGRSYDVLTKAVCHMEDAERLATLDSVKECYREAADFCRGLLSGKPRKSSHKGGDPWRTLTLSVLNNYQKVASFAERVDYFRLMPRFIQELEKNSLTDVGIKIALEKVIKITPNITQNGFEIGYERDEIYKISEVKTLLGFANTLRQLYKRAEENCKSQVLADTVRTIAHDFRRPFNLFRMTLSSLVISTDPRDIKDLAEEALPKIAKISEEVRHLLDDVVEAAKPMTLVKKEVVPCKVVASTLENLKVYEKEITIKTTYQSNQKIIADESKIKRAVLNILENAVQATRSGRIWIATNSATLHQQEATVITIGSDSYIPQADRKRLFEKYFSKGKTQGTGLGLYIVKRIMDEHGGIVRCRSSQKAGTEFDLVLPVG